jgi:hypothetical protein
LLSAVNIGALITQLQNSKLMNGGSAEERRAVFESLAPDKRDQLLSNIPPQALEGLPDFNRRPQNFGRPRRKRDRCNCES